MMKLRNLLSLLMALLLMCSLVACAGNTDDKNDAANDDAAVEDNTSDNTTTDDPILDVPAEDETTEDETTDDVIPEDETAEPDVEEETNEPEVEGDAPAAEGTLGAFFNTLSENYEMAMLADMDRDLIDAYLPGLNDITLVQSVMKMPMMSAVVCEIYLVECENADDAAKVAEIFEARKQAQVDGGAWYPESIAAWELTEIVTSGNFVALFAHSHAADMAADFDAAF